MIGPTRRRLLEGAAATLALAGCGGAGRAVALPDPAWPTPWGTLLAAGPGGIVEVDPATGEAAPRPALGPLTPAGIACTTTVDGRAVVLISEAASERLWRFVGTGARLGTGRLAVARLDPGGTLAWLPDPAAATPIAGDRELSPPGSLAAGLDWAGDLWAWREITAGC